MRIVIANCSCNAVASRVPRLGTYVHLDLVDACPEETQPMADRAVFRSSPRPVTNNATNAMRQMGVQMTPRYV